MIDAVYARKSTEQNGVSESPTPMPPDVREFVITKLTEILVLDYYHVHGLVPTDGAPSQQHGQPKPMKGGSPGTTR